MKPARMPGIVPLVSAVLTAALWLSPRAASATSSCAPGCSYADDFVITVTAHPTCLSFEGGADACSCASWVTVVNACDEPFTTDSVTVLPGSEGELPISIESWETTGEATFTGQHLDETITIHVTYDVAHGETFVAEPPSGCAAAPASPSSSGLLLVGLGLPLLAMRRRRR
ncbi:Hypothetical protein A7982_08615 [Minicystis rosea]|nr:Hypothetical protein A7982_08615 [Minicystis rosea]